MLVTREQPSFEGPFKGHGLAVHEGQREKDAKKKSSRLSDPAQRMLGGQQWRAGVVAPPSVVLCAISLCSVETAEWIDTETTYCVAWWLSGRALDLRFTGRRFNSQPVPFHVT